MASYNAINGVPSNINPLLLTEILKKQWGFQGFVVSDLGGVNTMVKGHMKGQMTYEDAVAKSLIAGCDFSDKEFETYLPAAVRQGLLPEERLNDAVFRVMRDRFRLGEFDPPEMVPYSKISPSVICSPEHRALALKAARESIVLLTNKNNFLPLDKSKLKKIAVIGPHADSLRRAATAAGPIILSIRYRESRIVPPRARRLYARGCEIRGGANASDDGANADDSIAEAAAIARGCRRGDCLRRHDQRDRGRGPRPHEPGLAGPAGGVGQGGLAANPKTVVVLMNAGPLTVPWIKDHAPAILEAWWSGVEGGNAIADVLFGDFNPAGRLPHTVYASESQVPPQDEYDVTKGFTYMYLNGEPLFAFGHGLSYTAFKLLKFAGLPQADSNDRQGHGAR